MTKKKIFIGATTLVALAAAFLLLSEKQLLVTQTIPVNGGIHNPFTPVVIQFNRPPRKDEVKFLISPSTEMLYTSPGDNAIQITPKESFLGSTQYTVTTNTRPPFLLTFTTEQVGSNGPGWDEQFDAAEKIYKDTYGPIGAAIAQIRKNTPIQEEGFTINYSYGNNAYTVTLNPPYATSKTAFINWMKNKGVTDLSSLRINYINK